MSNILFDFGGTIDTDGIHWSEKFRHLYEQFDVHPSRTDFDAAYVESEDMILRSRDLKKLTFYQTLNRQLTLQFSLLKLEDESDLLKQMIDACYQDVKRTIAKAKGVIDELADSYKLGLVSNFYGNLDVVCKEFGLDEYFDAIIDSTVVGVRKPDPEIFRLALVRLHSKATGTFVVGDSYERDIVPAKRLGCRTIWLQGESWMTPETSEAADYTIGKFKEIKPILLKKKS